VLKKWLGAFAVLTLLMGGAKAADGFAVYASSKSFLLGGVGVAYETGSLRFNLGVSGLTDLSLGLQAGAALLVTLIDPQIGNTYLYAGGGVEADLFYGVGLVSLYPYGALGQARRNDPYFAELRLGYAFLATASQGQGASAPLGFTLGLAFGITLPELLSILLPNLYYLFFGFPPTR
jgi:hypothetical protein